MGWNRDDAKKVAHLMDPKDQAEFAPETLTEEFYKRHPEMAPVVPPPKTDRLERDEQRQFANQLLLWNSEGRRIPFVWHSTAHRSKATPGTPDFMVGINGVWLCIEFKRDYSCQLSVDQQEFCENCYAQRLVYKVVYNCAEAIKLVEEADHL